MCQSKPTYLSLTLLGVHHLLLVFQPPNLCKTDGEVEVRSLACQGTSGTLRRETCGTALPPRRATPPVTLGAMHPKRAHRRCEAGQITYWIAPYSFGNNLMLRFHSKTLLSQCGNNDFPSSSPPGEGPREAGRCLDHESSHQTADRHGLPCELKLVFLFIYLFLLSISDGCSIILSISLLRWGNWNVHLKSLQYVWNLKINSRMNVCFARS